MNKEEEKEKGKESVAVISVHGIADQLPGQTVRELARLLCHGLDGPPNYVQGELQNVLVPVGKLHPGSGSLDDLPTLSLNGVRNDAVPALPAEGEPETARSTPGTPSGFYQMHQQAQALETTALAARHEDLSTDLNDYLMARLQMQEDDALYETLKISLRRRPGDGKVDLFEMHWADLSRLGGGGLKALSSLYQLFFHLSTFAADLVDHASISMQGKRAWHVLQRLHAWMAWLMKAPAAIVQLLMLLVMIFASAAWVPAERHGTLLAALYGAGALVLTTLAVFAWLRRPAEAPRAFRSAGLLALGAGCLALALYLLWLGYGAPSLYFGSSALVVALLGAYVIERYAKVSSGVRVAGHVLVTTMVVMLVASGRHSLASSTTVHEWMLTSAMRAGEVLFALLLLIWAIFIVVQIVGLVLGFWLVRDADEPVKATMHTARLMLIVSSGLFAVLSLVLWSALVYVVGLALGEARFSSLIFDPGYWSAAAFLDARIQALGGFFTPLVLAAMVVGIAVVLVMAPSMAQEVAPGINVDAKGVRSGADLSSARLGQWMVGGMARLDKALRVLIPVGALIGGVVYLAFVFQQFAVLAGVGGGLTQWLAGWLGYLRGEALVSTGKWLAGGAVTITALGAHFTRSFGRLRVAIDAVLDVDNYFADPPNRQPPRARIFSRYVSLLAYLREAGYSRIVIVSHSQGTVISADLLRYLHVQGRTEGVIGRVPISLITVGSPLRDLYARRFPLLYRWLGTREKGFAHATPAASELGLREWVNACRSGDYVGRFIWTSPDEQECYRVAALDAEGRVRALRAGDRTEFCLGAGAHTHYFSNDAVALAVEIDRLVAG
ncbi:MAG TPA: hypothetical protein VKZ70_06755 [Burkholderiaceae bacterium]|nr:hypothetical protein [Burkholderiaceae bacterium]